jgi:hypothetical protein
MQLNNHNRLFNQRFGVQLELSHCFASEPYQPVQYNILAGYDKIHPKTPHQQKNIFFSHNILLKKSLNIINQPESNIIFVMLANLEF